jgi:carboxymethylenebutenolidase
MAHTTDSEHASVERPVIETDVAIDTPDGTCDAAFIHPATGASAAVILWPDAGGLRPVMREMGRRLAAEGFAVLVPNPFYRIACSPVIEDFSTMDFSSPADRAKLAPLMGSIGVEGAAERDARAFVAWLDRQPQVDTNRKFGTQGYCMGGALAMRTAAALPDRFGAVASFHGGGLVTDRPGSPHLLAPKMRAQVYIGIASNDDQRQPDAKDTLRQAFEAAGRPAEIEVYPGLHGWCIRDMPMQGGHPIYNAADAGRAWTKLVDLYKTALG